MGIERLIRSGVVLVVLVVLALVAACDDGVGPAADFDPEVAAEAMEEMVTAVDTVELRNAFASLYLAESNLSGTMALAVDPANADPSTLESLARQAADVIPPELLGVTWEWSEAESSYVESDASGAPEDGVRVIYYAVDPFTLMPSSPLTPLGHIDVRDLSTAESDRLGVTIVHTAGDSDVTVADYYVDASFTETQSSLEVDLASVGYLSDGTTHLNFDVSQSLDMTETEFSIAQAYSLDLDGTDRSVTFTATATDDYQSESDEPAVMNAEATITGNGQTVVLDIAWADEVLEGSVSHNGATVVLIGGSLDDPEFTNPDGDPLTEAERQALQRVWEGIGQMFEFVENLFGIAM